jgi:hypothetical protein
VTAKRGVRVQVPKRYRRPNAVGINFAASDADGDAMQVAVAAMNRIHADTNPGLYKLGLRDCSAVGYQPPSR